MGAVVRTCLCHPSSATAPMGFIKPTQRKLPTCFNIFTTFNLHIYMEIQRVKNIVTCLTGGRGRIVPWIRSPLGIVALHGNEEWVGECWLPSNRGRIVPWIPSPLGIVALHGNEEWLGEFWLPSNRGRKFPWIHSPLGIVALHGNQP
jgi:hypothetical protein